MKIELGATIPTVQYGNLQPKLELETTKENYDRDMRALEGKMKELWDRYSEKPLTTHGEALQGTADDFVERVTFTGETILWSESKHEYRDLDGKVLLGGSTYAHQFEKEFDLKMMLPRCSKAWGVSEEVIADIWSKNSQVSTSFGDALHKALESIHIHYEDGEKIRRMKKQKAGAERLENGAIPRQPVLRKAILAFVDQFGIDALPEVLISDVKNGRAGSIDRLKIIDKEKKICRVQDYKTSAMDSDKTLVYQHQLSFYAKILQEMGWTVAGLDIFDWDGDKWTLQELEIKEVA